MSTFKDILKVIKPGLETRISTIDSIKVGGVIQKIRKGKLPSKYESETIISGLPMDNKIIHNGHPFSITVKGEFKAEWVISEANFYFETVLLHDKIKCCL